MPRIAVSAGSSVLGRDGTKPCIEEAQRLLEVAGCDVVFFPADGIGGRELESSLLAGKFAGVLDLTLTELADELAGGVCSAGPDRLTGAGLSGVARVIAPGGVDVATFGPFGTVPAKYAGRRFYARDATCTLMRTTPEENDRLGREIALKVSAGRGPAVVLLPLRGLSALDCEAGPFWWPEADAVLFQSVRNWISPHIRLVELDLHINDPEFALSAAGLLLRLPGMRE
jgi:uncharacterized protein (UPF0261 family)